MQFQILGQKCLFDTLKFQNFEVHVNINYVVNYYALVFHIVNVLLNWLVSCDLLTKNKAWSWAAHVEWPF